MTQEDSKMVIDISQEVFSCKVFPGDPKPEGKRVLCIEQGDICNLSTFSMCAHNGTHVDAPFHFLPDGNTLEKVALDQFVGDCYVTRYTGDLSAAEAEDILKKSREAGAPERLLIAGKATVTAEAARVFARSGVKLVGNESQTVGPEEGPADVHKILLGAEVVLLEGIVLTDVAEGRYFLCAAPLNLAGYDGAPCRAVLIK